MQDKCPSAMMLLLCDNRGANLDQEVRDNSLLDIPEKRELIIDTAAHEGAEVVGETILEVNSDSNLERLLDDMMEAIQEANPKFLVTTDTEALNQLGVLQPLLQRLAYADVELVQIIS